MRLRSLGTPSLILIGMALLLFPPVARAAEKAAAFATILEGIRPDDPKTLDATEDALVARGKGALPALRAALKEKQEAVARCEESPAALGETLRLRQQAEALDGAIVRLTWGFNPRERIAQWLKLKYPNGQAWLPRPVRIVDDALARALSWDAFYVLRFPTYPVARAVPPPLKSNNLLAVGRGGAVWLFTDPKALAAYVRDETVDEEIRTARGPAGDAEGVRQFVHAWLRLSEEFSQDGMFRFTIPAESLKAEQSADGWIGTGKAVVEPRGGNSGEIRARLRFRLDGTLVDVSEERQTKAGIRPICQATKLLDPDPIVRRMAEQDVRVMGRNAEAYLVERRAAADPPLRAAIERVWQQIISP